MASIKQIRRGLEIIEKYTPDSEVSVGHDEINAGSTEVKMSEPDEKELKEIGWFENEDFECWMRFV